MHIHIFEDVIKNVEARWKIDLSVKYYIESGELRTRGSILWIFYNTFLKTWNDEINYSLRKCTKRYESYDTLINGTIFC